jgi:hypothetical protein
MLPVTYKNRVKPIHWLIGKMMRQENKEAVLEYNTKKLKIHLQQFFGLTMTPLK